ncbi:hypothetical protein AMTR_s00027p00233840 [Amborella trichopoda]|uniref:E3 ubiquitin ligase UBR4 C-terminal domain-containing protein n=1 Tax=Amborella trichopoda TaxID=13333 RepID=W1PSJ2_AMBTC|nr:hypothetical protein AMTR_s00027p00233840 [Amborella trichopoda]
MTCSLVDCYWLEEQHWHSYNYIFEKMLDFMSQLAFSLGMDVAAWAWRKTVDDLKKDKTCQFKIAAQPYNPNDSTTTVSWLIERDIRTATYFIRAYALDSQENDMAYGQTTGKNKTTNLFEIQGITGTHASLDIAAACFSAFLVFCLFGFFIRENRCALLELGALGLLLETARRAFFVDVVEPAEGMLLIVESLTMEANESDIGISESVLAASNNGTSSGAGEQARRVLLMLLERLSHPSGLKKSAKQQRNNAMVA